VTGCEECDLEMWCDQCGQPVTDRTVGQICADVLTDGSVCGGQVRGMPTAAPPWPSVRLILTARQATVDAHKELKRACLRALRDGVPLRQVAIAADLSRTTIYAWKRSDN
jgi:hypothetical protein